MNEGKASITSSITGLHSLSQDGEVSIRFDLVPSASAAPPPAFLDCAADILHHLGGCCFLRSWLLQSRPLSLSLSQSRSRSWDRNKRF